jgi:hypothetical protein
MISIIVITKNEADDIRECLKSISWADEIIILDSGSLYISGLARIWNTKKPRSGLCYSQLGFVYRCG